MHTVQMYLIEDIAGVAEIASMLGVPKQTVCNWVARRTYDAPQPIAELAATRLYSRSQWAQWAAAHPPLVLG